jgi:hypothetical protein
LIDYVNQHVEIKIFSTMNLSEWQITAEKKILSEIILIGTVTLK